jgi:ribosomal-protein-alanine N-acetyltransferase
MPEAAIANGPATVVIDRMTEHDLLEVVEIEESANLSPWGWDAYHTELLAGANSLMLVARRSHRKPEEGGVAGFIVARQVTNEIHINNVAVRPEFRRLGIGQQLLWAALSWGRQKNATQGVLEVRAGNTAAQKLYQACGFEPVGRRRRYYKAPVEDALLMAVFLKERP